VRNAILNLTIHLPEEDVQALTVKARVQGMSAEEYAVRVIERDLAPEWLRASWASAEKAGLNEMTLDEIDAEITAARRSRRVD
jgi:hypothetical protein